MSKRAAARIPLPNAHTTYPTTTASCTTDATPLTRNLAPAASWAAFLQYYAPRRKFEEAGFQQYEVSNFARPGRESLHNSRYWDRTPYLGLGPGAHSFDGRHRRWNLPDNQLYISTLTSNTSDTRNYYAEETLTPADAHNELLMTALRTTRGLPLSAVKEEHRPHLLSVMQRYIACGWIAAESDGNQQFFRPTPEGLLHADGMAATLFV